MSWYDPFNVIDMFNPSSGYKKAGKDYSKGFEQAQQYGKPYWQSGIDQLSQLTGAENKLLDPAALQSEWAQGYEMSPYAQQLQKEASSQGMDAASQMGLLGSSAALQNLQNTSSNIMNKDRQQYMDDLMKKYMSGIGIGQDIYGTGASMGSQLGNQAMNFGQGMGNLDIGQKNSQINMLLNMLGLAGKAMI